MKARSSIPASFLERGFVNTTLIAILAVMDCVSIYNLASDIMVKGRPSVILAIAASFISMIDLGAIVFGFILSDKLRRQTLIRTCYVLLTVCIVLGIGFLIGIRVFSKDAMYGDTEVVTNMISKAGDEAETSSAAASSGLSPVLKTLVNVFMAVQIIGTSGISFCLSAIRTNHMKIVTIEKLEKKVSTIKSEIEYLTNLLDVDLRRTAEELTRDHEHKYDTIRAENQKMKTSLLAQFTTGANIQWLKADIVRITEAPSIPFVTDEAAELFEPDHPENTPDAASTAADHPDRSPESAAPADTPETASPADTGSDPAAQKDDDFEEDV